MRKKSASKQVKCTWCLGLGFAISERDDGIDDIQKCDQCAIFRTDVEAVRAARRLLEAAARGNLLANLEALLAITEEFIGQMDRETRNEWLRISAEVADQREQ